MKKIFSILMMGLFGMAAMAQQAVITFEKTEHDFGKINEADGRVTTVFEFKNEGMEPLILSNVRASCGCTTPKWTKEPIEPGQNGQITVTYNPNGRPGRFQKTITVTSNATEATKRLFIKGEVIPKPAKPVNQYTVKMGDLSLKANSIAFGTIKKGEKAQKEIEYANLTDKELTVELATNNDDNYLYTEMSLSPIKKGETGKLIAIFDAAVCKTYGPVEAAIYPVINGKKVLTDEYKITITADVQENFDNLTIQQRQNAPICEVEKNINLGTVAPGKKIAKNINIKNAGASTMAVRRAYTSATELTLAAPKSIKNGKTGSIKVTVNTQGLAVGAYEREMTVITNDPVNPRKTIRINWTIE